MSIDTRTIATLPEFSLFKEPISNKVPYKTINIQDLHKIITTDTKLSRLTAQVSNIKDKVGRNKVKTNLLPYITPSGIFRCRENEYIKFHSGYLCVDLDNLESEQMQQVKDNLLNDVNIQTCLLFRSPSRNGYKWFIRIPNDVSTHLDYFNAVENYLLKTYNYQIDGNCKDVSRACFLSYDEDAYINPIEVKQLDIEFLTKWIPEKMTKKANLSNQLKTIEDKLKGVNLLIAELQSQSLDITKSYSDWMKIGLALCELGEDGRQPFHDISCLSNKYDEDECDEKYSELLTNNRGTVTLGTLFYIATKNGILPPNEKLKALLNLETKFDAAQLEVTKMFPRTAKQRMDDAKNQPPIKKLLGSIWFSGELHILFGDNGTGKSVWATQIADALTNGKSAMNILPNETEPQKVLFYDFELSDKQFERRYTDETGGQYQFSENLFIDNIDFQSLSAENVAQKPDEMIITKIEQAIVKLKPQVLIIDNLTYLKTETTQDAKVALEILRKLNQLKRQYDLSILVLAHTPKTKDGQPITNNDLAGSKHLSNLVDSISAIGKSKKGKNEKYIKQIKARSGEKQFDTEDVISVELVKNGSFLGFEYLYCENEYEHLADTSRQNQMIEKQMLKQQVFNLKSEGLSIREIEDKVAISKSTIQRWLKESDE